MNTVQVNTPEFNALLARADLAGEIPHLDDDPDWDAFLALGLAADVDDLPEHTEWRRTPVMLSY
jgi:hypothetical protein